MPGCREMSAALSAPVPSSQQSSEVRPWCSDTHRDSLQRQKQSRQARAEKTPRSTFAADSSSSAIRNNSAARRLRWLRSPKTDFTCAHTRSLSATERNKMDTLAWLQLITPEFFHPIGLRYQRKLFVEGVFSVTICSALVNVSVVSLKSARTCCAISKSQGK